MLPKARHPSPAPAPMSTAPTIPTRIRPPGSRMAVEVRSSVCWFEDLGAPRPSAYFMTTKAMKPYSTALTPAISRLLAFRPSGPAPPYSASDRRHKASPIKLATSSHSNNAPGGVLASTRTAPLWSAWSPELPKAIPIARMPMNMYMRPRAVNPARPSQST
jgi:hypothetical protein